MCNRYCLDFVERNLEPDEVRGKSVIESGARDVNGSVRPAIMALNPLKYLGTDIAPGKRVDLLCPAEELVETLGEQSCDVLISTEVIEHVADWRTVLSNYKRVLRPGGVLFITTRSLGFPFHEYPIDSWRYELSDMREIFADFEILVLEDDPLEPGVFLKARRPEAFRELDLSEYALYSVMDQRRMR